MKRPYLRVALAVLLCLIILTPAARGRDWRRSIIRMGHPNELVMMTSVRVGEFRIALIKQPLLGFTLLAIRANQPVQSLQTSPVSTGSVSTRPAR